MRIKYIKVEIINGKPHIIFSWNRRWRKNTVLIVDVEYIDKVGEWFNMNMLHVIKQVLRELQGEE